jgi:hypothetical protein
VAGGALLGGGSALLDRGGLQQLFDRLGRGGRSGGTTPCDSSFTAISKPGFSGILGENTALAAKLVTRTRMQVPRTAPRILLSSKESIVDQAPSRKVT